jgi:HK97 family phage portal protein
MANFFTRLLGLDDTQQEDRAVSSIRVAPARTAVSTVSTVDAGTSLSLTSVFRAIQILATPISKMDVKTIRYIASTGEEQQIANPLLVNAPSLLDSRREFIYQTVVSLATTGEAFWLKKLSSTGAVNSLEIIPSKNVRVEVDKLTGVKYFSYSHGYYPNHVVDVVPATEMEHLKLFAIPGELRGFGPVQLCKDDIAGALDLREYASTWFSSGGVPTGVLTSNSMLTAEQADEITARWHDKQSERKVAVLGNGFEYDPVSLSPKEALFTDVQNQSVQQIARMFGIPARLLLTGVDGTSDTYTNLSDENQVFYRHTLMAYLDAIEDAMSNCLPRGQRVKFDYEGLFKADVTQRYTNYAVGLQNQFLTVDEVRAKEGLDG